MTNKIKYLIGTIFCLSILIFYCNNVDKYGNGIVMIFAALSILSTSLLINEITDNKNSNE